tara:strand:- start:260 stop:472 length:213 start_codon:yes stop_codon:yes gene_type:complete
MNLPDIIKLYSMMIASEEEGYIVKRIPQSKLREQPFVPIVIEKKKPKVSAETWLDKNLKGFMRYMIEYAE